MKEAGLSAAAQDEDGPPAAAQDEAGLSAAAQDEAIGTTGSGKWTFFTAAQISRLVSIFIFYKHSIFE